MQKEGSERFASCVLSTTHISQSTLVISRLYGGGGGRISGSMLILLSYAASDLVDPNLQCYPGVVVECISVGGSQYMR